MRQARTDTVSGMTRTCPNCRAPMPWPALAADQPTWAIYVAHFRAPRPHGLSGLLDGRYALVGHTAHHPGSMPSPDLYFTPSDLLTSTPARYPDTWPLSFCWADPTQRLAGWRIPYIVVVEGDIDGRPGRTIYPHVEPGIHDEGSTAATARPDDASNWAYHWYGDRMTA